MEPENPDFNLSAIKQVTRLLLAAGVKSKEKDENQGRLETERFRNLMQKIEALESRYESLKGENRDNVKLDNIKMHLNLIKNKLEELS